MKTLRVYMSGTVQGHLFRNYLEEQGKRIGVRGFLRQMQDGRIEIVMEGRDDKIKVMLEVCRKGTIHAQVRNLEMQEIPNQGLEGFRIYRI